MNLNDAASEVYSDCERLALLSYPGLFPAMKREAKYRIAGH